jgi:hypothetical protein
MIARFVGAERDPLLVFDVSFAFRVSVIDEGEGSRVSVSGGRNEEQRGNEPTETGHTKFSFPSHNCN